LGSVPWDWDLLREDGGTEGAMKRKRASRFSLESNTAAPQPDDLPDIVHEAGTRSFHRCASPRIGNAAWKHGFAVGSYSHDGFVLALHLPKHPVRDLEVDDAAADDDSVDDEPPDIQAEIEVGTGCSRHAERKNLAVDDVVVVDPRDPCSLRRRSFARS
jgi:hypothetical protein